jgi:hypothetical protein
VPPKLRKVGISGRLGIPLTPVAMTTCRGCISRFVPSARRSNNGPSPLLFVVRAALEFGGRAIVEFHAFYISLEPGGEFVLGNIGQRLANRYPAAWKGLIVMWTDQDAPWWNS